ncbi:MAG: 30S ribosomal protein S7 [Planctomycetes bacterium]|nr:30S ribosomal protein S7 [Planctomycetota bacterium]MCB9905707.1 30S ribosomal protein S7 [Planctomycetota bacterium]
MPRNYKSTAAHLKPDPKFGSMLATKIINKIMLDGKKSTAQKIFYDALDLASKKLPEAEDQVEIFTKALENIRPMVEVRSKRVGGANYQVPREVKRSRQQSLAIRWMVDNSRKKKGKPMALRLSEEIVDAYNGTGASVQWKENVHKMAEANKAYAHYA